MVAQVGSFGTWQIVLPELKLRWSNHLRSSHGSSVGSLSASGEAFDFRAEEQQILIRQFLCGCIRKSLPFDTEAQIVLTTGQKIWVRAIGETVIDAGGEVCRIQGAIQDVSQQHAQQGKLRLLETAVAHLNDMVLITEAEPFTELGPRIVFVNDAFTRQTGYALGEVIGRTPRILQGPDTNRVELDRIRDALEKQQAVCSELLNYTKAGKKFWVEVDIVPMADETGANTHFVAVERDITERKLAQEKLISLNNELEDRVRRRTTELENANRELETFSYSVAHDLRSPLQTINLCTRLLDRTDAERLSEKGRLTLSRVVAGSQQMGKLIDRLLMLAQTSRDDLQIERVDLSAIARDIEQALREQDPERDVGFHVEEGLVVEGDRLLLGAVLQNLIGNAWKFTARRTRGEITVGRQLAADGQPVYIVKDNGAGFDMSHYENLFGTFQRLHSSEKFSGTGIGLSIVRRILERHGGRVWAEAKVDEGATFYFVLSRASPD